MNFPLAQTDLFGDSPIKDVPTDGIKYIGSKLRLLPEILKVVRRLEVDSIFDGFTGSTRVAQALAKVGYSVHSSDISVWSEIFAQCYLGSKRGHNYTALIEELNKSNPIDGWFTHHYGGDPQMPRPDGLKKPWQLKNTRKLDAIRRRIDELCLEPHERAVALTSLINALDKVDSTIGHFASYLNQWSPRSYNDLVLREPTLVHPSAPFRHSKGDIFDVVGGAPASDLAYLDPPYGSNNEKMPPSRVRYASYYHLWTTICLNDEPDLFGKALRREDSRDKVASTVFEDFRRSESGRFLAVEAIEKIIARISSRYILLSYSSGDRATLDELFEVLRKNGDLRDMIEIEYKRNVMANMRWTHEWVRPENGKNIEYLFLLDKGE